MQIQRLNSPPASRNDRLVATYIYKDGRLSSLPKASSEGEHSETRRASLITQRGRHYPHIPPGMPMLTPQDIAIANARVMGATLRDIEPEVGIDHSTVGRKLNHPEVKQYIESLHAQLISESLGTAAANIQMAVDQYRPQAELPADQRDGQLREHGFKASQRLLESVGILPSHAPSVMIQQIFNGNTIVSQDLGKLLSGMFAGPVSDPVDVQYNVSSGQAIEYKR